MIESMKKDDLIRMLVTLWAIWHAKRKAVHEEIFQSPMATIAFVNKFLGDLGETSLQGERARGRTRPKTGRKKWLAPPAGRSKINVDVAVAKSTPKGRWELSAALWREFSLVQLPLSMLVSQTQGAWRP
jgi:hypothetical protein